MKTAIRRQLAEVGASVRRFLILASTLVSVILASCWVATAISLSPRSAPAASVSAEQPGGTPTTLARYRVGNTGGVGVYIRRTPRLVDQIRAWADGSVLEQVGPDVFAEGILWHQVRDGEGNVGWVPAAYLIQTNDVPR